MPDALAAVLLRRRRLVDTTRLTPPVRRSAWQWLRHPLTTQAGLVALQGDLIQRGFLLSATLYRYCAGLSPLALTGFGQTLLDLLDTESGKNASLVPLFRGFPESVPGNTETFYINRVFARLLQEPHQPCVLCGEVRTVHLVSPCSHLVCRTCWDGSDFTACPICLRPLDPHDPFLHPPHDDRATHSSPGGVSAGAPGDLSGSGPSSASASASAGAGAGVAEEGGEAPGVRLQLLALAPEGAARSTAVELLTRRAPLSVVDRADLTTLLIDPTWLPDDIPVRETRAVALAALVTDHPELLDQLAETATDVLRLLYVLMGGDPSLRTPPVRRLSAPRVTRRTILARLNRIPFENLVDDLHRHPRAWKRIAENLHPFEHATTYPAAALAFAILRRTPLSPPSDPIADGGRTGEVSGSGGAGLAVGRGPRSGAAAAGKRRWLDSDSPAGRAVFDEAVRHPQVRVEDGRFVVKTFAGRLEGAFADGRPGHALDLLRDRPGELVRRLVHLARALPADAHGTLVDALTTAVSDVSPVVLTAALSQVRTPPGDLRLFFPRGGITRVWTAVDEREPLPAGLAAALSGVLVGEMLRRATGLPAIRRTFLDEELVRLVAPGSERSSSSTLRRMTRGSVQPIPDDELLRLFLHWVEPPAQRVDLDLAVAVFDDEWAFVGLCDPTRLRFDQDAMVHSGNLTAAPGPRGATEYVDLDLRALRRIGARYVLPVVFSFNGVPFNALERGFIGLMRDPAELFDPVAVEDRFDLTGSARMLLPFGIDLRNLQLRWYDVNLSAAGYGNSLVRNAGQVALMAATLEEVHGAGDRVTLWEVCCWHAAARTTEVVVRCADGSIVGYLRGESEDVTTFARRLTARLEPDRYWDLDAATRADFVAVITGDVDPKSGADVYALHPHLLDPGSVHLIDAPHLLTTLTPDTRARQSVQTPEPR
ncbi:MXAN_6230/SCO0854 family RING domain-containing protein [Kribbella qitaiheensis]|uniref:MXAN_6230/SCO0854 family RING domain-containing protein n=1 Tax=Kribbella qitaiheensis TaxID=1544730 RepID=UPI001FECB49F|nr:MXAN_6230/SCO0854 family RING domain-containing protein [Kribbella qitaiheensis]